MTSYCYLRTGPSENKIWKACEKSVKVLDCLKENDTVKKGKHPYVSCVILDEFGNILQDEQGELITLTDPKTKKHAEAKAIERLLLSKDNLYEKAHTLLTTLEPCSYRNIANHPEEIACAKMIIYAGIKQVLVGIVDPELSIRGHGLNMLASGEIYFSMFPSSFYNDIRKKNKKYLENVRDMYGKDEPLILIGPYAEFELANAPKSIRHFLVNEKKAGKLSSIRDKVKNLRNPHKIQAYVEKNYDGEIMQGVLDELKNKKSGNFTLYEKVAQYIASAISTDDVDRNGYILFMLINWMNEIS